MPGTCWEADEFGYALLFAFISIGAIINAMFIPRLRARFNNDQLITGASLVFAAGMIITALTQIYIIALFTLALCGSAWITVMTCAQTAAQTALPNWVRSRGHRRFPDILYGLAGYWSRHLGWPGTTDHHSCCYLYCVNIAWQCPPFLPDAGPSAAMKGLTIHPPGTGNCRSPLLKIKHEQGPVMINITYQVKPESRQEFLLAMEQLGKARRRDGAWEWGIMENISKPCSFREFYPGALLA